MLACYKRLTGIVYSVGDALGLENGIDMLLMILTVILTILVSGKRPRDVVDDADNVLGLAKVIETSLMTQTMPLGC